jgi:hypothetical protein
VTRASRPVGTITRGTTHPNRLRRVDRWIAHSAARALGTAPDPLVVDLGYGAAAWTPRDLRDHLRALRADVEVVGIEIDPARVAAAAPYSDATLSFRRGGFEVPLDGRSPVVIRAFNVLRQYDESEVDAAWQAMTARLAPGGSWSRAPATSSAGTHGGSRSSPAPPPRGRSRSRRVSRVSTVRRTSPSGCPRR